MKSDKPIAFNPWYFMLLGRQLDFVYSFLAAKEKNGDNQGHKKSLMGTSHVVIKGRVYEYIIIGDIQKFYGGYILISAIYWFTTSHGWIGMSH